MLKYAQASGIFGLEFIADKRNTTLERSFWAFVILLFTALTANDLSKIVQTYLDEETVATLVSTTEKNVTLDPPPTVCLWFNAHLFALETNVTTIGALIDEFEADLANGSSTIDRRLVFLWYAILSDLGRRENTILDFKPENASGWTTFNMWSYNSHRDAQRFEPFAAEIQSTLSFVYTATAKKFKKSGHVTFEGLSSVVAAELLRLTSFRAHYGQIKARSPVEVFQPCVTKPPTTFESGQFCCRLSDDVLVFSHPLDYLFFKMQTKSVLLPYNASEVQAFAAKLQLDGVSGRTFYYGFENAVVLGNNLEVNVRVDGTYIRYDKRKQPCSSSTRFYDCVEDCWARRRLRACGCWPFLSTLAGGGRSIPIDNRTSSCVEPDAVSDLPLISLCGRRQAVLDSDVDPRSQICKKDACLADCKVTAYTYQSVYVGAFTFEPGDIFTVVAMPSRTSPVFEERLVMDWQVVLANTGGILGLWLGLSFAALVNIPIAMGKSLGTRVCRHCSGPNSAALFQADTVKPVRYVTSDELELAVAELEQRLLSKEAITRL